MAATVRDLSHTFSTPAGPLAVLAGVSLSVARGEAVAVIGPSGCGKSTLLRCLAGLERPSAGVAELDGGAAFMAQRDALMPWKRALANATLGAEVAGVARREARAHALALLGPFGLAGFERAWPGELSGGMRQRLALLRTFLTPSSTLLLDEPLGALDAITRRDLQGWVEERWLAEQPRRALLLVTHDVEEALLLSDRVVVLSARPGRFVAEVPRPWARPRPPALVLEADFVAAKADLLKALEG